MEIGMEAYATMDQWQILDHWPKDSQACRMGLLHDGDADPERDMQVDVVYAEVGTGN